MSKKGLAKTILWCHSTDQSMKYSYDTIGLHRSHVIIFKYLFFFVSVNNRKRIINKKIVKSSFFRGIRGVHLSYLQIQKLGQLGLPLQ